MMKKSAVLLLTILVVIASASLVAQTRYDVPVSDGIRPIAMPWTGGMNAPQFANIDFNRDGITDLISFDRQGDVLRTYIHLPASGRWEQYWEYESIFPKMVDWVQIVDFDQDGVEDLFTSSSALGVAGVTVYKGSYENDTWSFTKMPDRGKDYLQLPAGPGLTNVYVAWDDIPSIADIDNDGDIDILSFDPGGTYIHFYENKSVQLGWGADSLRFELGDFCWGKILENELTEEVYLSDNPNMCSDGNYAPEDEIKPRHAGSTIATLDIDFDGDRDAWLGDISSRHLVFLHNGLNAQDAWITAQESSYPNDDVIIDLPYFVAAYFVELDDDPEPELLAAVNSRSLSEDRQSVWRYDDDLSGGPLHYTLTEKGWLQNEMIDVGSHSRPAVTDINGDGLQDLVIGGYHFTDASETRIPSLTLYLNKGTLSEPYYHFATDDYLGMSQFAANPTFDFAPAFGDLDGDGDIDMIVGEQNGKLFYYQNITTAGDSIIFAAPVYPFMDIAVGVSATPQIADINGDGLADLVIGERTGNADGSGRCSNLNYFQNIGTTGNPLFVSDVNQSPNTGCFGRILFDIPIGLPQYSTPSIVSTTEGLILMTGGDPGKLNIYSDLLSGPTGELLLIAESYGAIDVGNRSAPLLADINHDQKYELLIGNHRGGLELFTTDIQVGTTSIASPEIISKPYRMIHDPGNGRVEIQWGEISGTAHLMDQYGRHLARYEGQLFQPLQMDALPSGMYFLRLELHGNSWVEKVIKL